MRVGDLKASAGNANVRAFLRALRLGEGTKDERGYSRLFGGRESTYPDGHFESFADHPRVTVRKGGYVSSAAGAYQIIKGTWDGLVRQYGFGDFSPASQDLAAIALIAEKGALEDVEAGRLDAAMWKCRKVWASLPTSPDNQPKVTKAQFLAEYVAHGGKLGEEQVAAPVEDRDVLPIAAAILPTLIPTLISKAPELVKIFTDKETPVSERNTQAAIKVLEIAKEVTEAPNEQAAVEAIVAQPELAERFRERVRQEWYELENSIESIKVAQAFALEYAKSPRNWPLEIVTYVFTAIFGASVLRVLWTANFTSDQITMVLQAAIGLSLIVGSFWLGASFTTSKSRGLNARPPEV